MKKYIVCLILFASLTSFVQNITKSELDQQILPLTKQLKSIKNENSLLKQNISNLDRKIVDTNILIDSLKKLTIVNQNDIANTKSELGIKISTTETSTNQKIIEVDKSLSKSSLYGIIGVLTVALLSGLVYWLLNRKQTNDRIDLVEQLNVTKSSIEESLVAEFGKQTALMESDLLRLAEQKELITTIPNVETDHSLALKVADEITLIERNISLMDSGTRGLKQLSRSVGKLRDNLFANGYEMPELLGKPLNTGMRVIPISTIPDENLPVGVEMISKIIKPQVNYNDKMIQAAQIEVSVGY